MRPFILSFIMTPNIIGNILSGPIMDSIGRKKTHCFFGISCVFSFTLLCFSQNYTMFVIACGLRNFFKNQRLYPFG